MNHLSRSDRLTVVQCVCSHIMQIEYNNNDKIIKEIMSIDMTIRLYHENYILRRSRRNLFKAITPHVSNENQWLSHPD